MRINLYTYLIEIIRSKATDECALPMRKITEGRTAIAYSEYILENASLAFRDLYELPGPGSVRGSRNIEN
jgi:hypothetical protein